MESTDSSTLAFKISPRADEEAAALDEEALDISRCRYSWSANLCVLLTACPSLENMSSASRKLSTALSYIPKPQSDKPKSSVALAT